MIEFSIESDGGTGRVSEVVARLMEAIDLRPVAESMGEIVEADNATARMSGIDRFGNEVLDILPEDGSDKSTRKWRRKTGRGNGPALDPDFGTSSIIKDMTTEVDRVDGYTWSLYGVWPAWVEKHRDGIPSKVGPRVRDVLGVTPDGDEKLHERFNEGVDQILAGIR
jgi:hypothetical protein